MSRADYLAALHAALDARRDPLDDVAVRGWLAAHPEDLPEFAAMRAVLTAPPARVPAAPPAIAPPRSFRWPMLFPPLAAAAALLWFLRADRQPAESTPPPAGASAVLAVYESSSTIPAGNPPAALPGAAVLAASIQYTRTSAF